MVLVQDLLQPGLDEYVRSGDDVVRRFCAHLACPASFPDERQGCAQGGERSLRLGSKVHRRMQIHNWQDAS